MAASIQQSKAGTSKSGNIRAFHYGYLNKHVNALKGFQTRFFVVNAEDGRLDYYLTKDAFQKNQKDYRGSIALAGTEVAPREEDSVSFNVFGANGQVFQLKADTAKDRQKWVDAIRFCVQKHNEATIDPLAVTRPHQNKASMSGVGKKKKRANQMSTTVLLPTQEIVNTREAINNAEQALQQMSEIIANYPLKTLNNNNAAATSSPSAAAQGPKNKAVASPPTGGRVSQIDMSYYESMLSIKAFSVACLQDLKLCFEAVQSEYFKNRVS